MRAREFITENHRRFDLTNPQLTGARHMPDMDKYYELYRLSLDMAQVTDDITGDAKGQPVKDHPVLVAYSKGDEEIVRKALRKRGFKSSVTSSQGSHETADTNTTSPTAKPKRNRYGV